MIFTKNKNLKIRIMARIKLLQQASVLNHEGDYTIGLAISNNDLILLENGLVSAIGILSNYAPNETNLNARLAIQGFAESLSQYKTWKENYLKSSGFNPIPSNLFLTLPDSECTLQLGIKTDDNIPSQIILLSLQEVEETASALRFTYDLVDDIELMGATHCMSGVLEIFEGFLATVPG
jgi:hypothetical protein